MSFLRIGWLGALGVICLSGCTKHFPLEEEGPAPIWPIWGEESFVRRLGLKIQLQNVHNPSKPGATTHLEGTLIDGAEASFTSVLVFPKADLLEFDEATEELKPLGHAFLVWEEGGGTDRITDALYEHRSISAMGEASASGERIPAGYDPKERRWFIPLHEVLLGQTDPTVDHLILLDLQLESGTRVLVRVRLRVLGPVPRIIQESLATEYQKLGLGWAVSKIRLSNPSRLKLMTWFKTSTQSIEAQVGLRFEGYQGHSTTSPTPFANSYQSLSEFAVTELRVRRKGGVAGPASEQFHSQEWVGVSLGPYEEIEVTWVAHPKPG